jgi:hypothetical protein
VHLAIMKKQSTLQITTKASLPLLCVGLGRFSSLPDHFLPFLAASALFLPFTCVVLRFLAGGRSFFSSSAFFSLFSDLAVLRFVSVRPRLGFFSCSSSAFSTLLRFAAVCKRTNVSCLIATTQQHAQEEATWAPWGRRLQARLPTLAADLTLPAPSDPWEIQRGR